MVQTVVAIVFAILGLAVASAGFLLWRRNRKFRKKAVYVTGKAVTEGLESTGYQHVWYFMVKDKDGSEKQYLSQMFRPKQQIHAGEEVQLALLRDKTFGLDTYELRVVDERYTKLSEPKVHIVLIIIGAAFLAAAIALAAI